MQPGNLIIPAPLTVRLRTVFCEAELQHPPERLSRAKAYQLPFRRRFLLGLPVR